MNIQHASRDTRESSSQQRIRRAWSELTNEEQKAVLTVLALAVLGIAVRLWHAIAR